MFCCFYSPEDLFLPGLLVPAEQLAAERPRRLVPPLLEQVVQVALTHRQVVVLLQQSLTVLRHRHRLFEFLVLNQPVDVIVLI